MKNEEARGQRYYAARKQELKRHRSLREKMIEEQHAILQRRTQKRTKKAKTKKVKRSPFSFRKKTGGKSV